ncbi:hypothetical protein [Wielerella bovis]|uniref:hypothetical protein n=1 Tax=Wielerella bovis TaxID=2917790 RepID=UPI00201968E6|nr:hypothetical protein [Wielerella bovis]ULJ60179.1 hypothetical protein MIS44_11080 [Wielerella bovis]
MMKNTWKYLLLIFWLNACATTAPSNPHTPQHSPSQKVIRAANWIVYVPLCFMYGICPDISEDE